jgi:hypothetical protein
MQEEQTGTTPRLALKSKAAPHTPATPATPTSPTLTTIQAAEFLNVKPATLEQWRWRGVGPVFCKLNRACRYRLSDLQKYLEDAVRTSTTDQGRAEA